MLISRNLHMKSSEVSIKTSSSPASLSFKDQALLRTQKWCILTASLPVHLCQRSVVWGCDLEQQLKWKRDWKFDVLTEVLRVFHISGTYCQRVSLLESEQTTMPQKRMHIRIIKYPPKHFWVRYLSYDQAFFDKISLGKVFLHHCNTFNPVRKQNLCNIHYPPNGPFTQGNIEGGKRENSVEDFAK